MRATTPTYENTDFRNSHIRTHRTSAETCTCGHARSKHAPVSAWCLADRGECPCWQFLLTDGAHTPANPTNSGPRPAPKNSAPYTRRGDE